MKKYFILLIMALSMFLVSCSDFPNITFSETSTFKTLNKVVYPKKEYTNYNYNDEVVVDPINKCTSLIINELFTENKNYVFSPISLYMALSMLTEGAESKTYEDLKKFLGFEDLNSLQKQMKNIYNHNYYKNDDGQLRMANSIWIENDYPVENSYLNTLANEYYAESYHTDFDDTGKENIISWINNYTNDFLNLTKDNYQINSDTRIMLINTIYFDNKWQKEFKTSDSYTDTFNVGKEKVDVKYMKHSVASSYYECDDYEIVNDYFKNNNRIKFILPKEGKDIVNLLNNETLFGQKDMISVEASLSIPKFKYQNNYNLNDTLIALGLGNMFNEEANFHKISSNNIMVSFIKQDVGIELNEEGVKAAAVSSIGLKESAMEPGMIISIKLDRPFIYVIYDSENVPLFVGVISNPNK